MHSGSNKGQRPVSISIHVYLLPFPPRTLYLWGSPLCGKPGQVPEVRENLISNNNIFRCACCPTLNTVFILCKLKCLVIILTTLKEYLRGNHLKSEYWVKFCYCYCSCWKSIPVIDQHANCKSKDKIDKIITISHKEIDRKCLERFLLKMSHVR